MTTVLNETPSVMMGKLESSWDLFAVLGGMMLIAGGVASFNLFATTLVSLFYIVAFMLLCGVMQLFHAFNTHGWKRRVLYGLSALSYLAAGGVAFYDPILSAVGISLLIGGFLVASGAFRIMSGLRDQSHEGWGWVVASGALTLAVGGLLLVSWPGISLWFLGALLTVDLIFQGCSYIAFAVALHERYRRLDPDLHHD